MQKRNILPHLSLAKRSQRMENSHLFAYIRFIVKSCYLDERYCINFLPTSSHYFEFLVEYATKTNLIWNPIFAYLPVSFENVSLNTIFSRSPYGNRMPRDLESLHDSIELIFKSIEEVFFQGVSATWTCELKLRSHILVALNV